MPTVRFFQSRRGARMAYADGGQGPPLVFPAWWVSHLERDAEDPGFRAFFAGFEAHFRTIRYDRRGVGLSDRGPTDNSLEAEVEDLEALVEHLQLPPAHLFAFSGGGPTALAYAARHPDQVEKVVCYGTFLWGATLAEEETQRALASLVRAHWGLGSKLLTDLFHPGADAEAQGHYTALQRAAADPETAARLLELTYAVDARPFAAAVRAPVLVLHRRGDRVIRYEAGRTLAGALANAQLVTLEGNIHLPWAGDGRAVIDRASAFLNGVAPASSSTEGEFRRDGEVWTVRFAQRQVLLKDGKGLSDLARLLAQPDREFHPFDLLGVPEELRTPRQSQQPTLDRQALAAYRRRLAELDEALEECPAGEARQRISTERDALLDQLAAQTGLKGRPRRMNDAAERARKTVTARIRDAIRRIASIHPELGEHLRASVVTGAACAYRPSQRVNWTVAPGPS